jgi:hypothetical protein
MKKGSLSKEPGQPGVLKKNQKGIENFLMKILV